MPDLDAGIGQGLGVGIAFVAQRVVLRRADDGGRDARQIGLEQHRRARVQRAPALCVGVTEPPHVLGRQEQPLGVLQPGRMVAPVLAEVRPGIDEQLTLQRHTCITGPEGNGRRQVAPGTVAGHCDAAGVAAELPDLLDRPDGGGQAIVVRRGERVLRRQPVVDRQHRNAGLAAEQARLVVMGLEVAHDEPATVEEHDGRDITIDLRAVEPGRQVAGRTRDDEVNGLAHRRQRGWVAHIDGHGSHPEAGLLGGHRGERDGARLGQEVEDRRDDRINGHARTLAEPAHRRRWAPRPLA